MITMTIKINQKINYKNARSEISRPIAKFDLYFIQEVNEKRLIPTFFMIENKIIKLSKLNLSN